MLYCSLMQSLLPGLDARPPCMQPGTCLVYLLNAVSLQASAFPEQCPEHAGLQTGQEFFDEAEKEPDKKMSSALTKQAQQWLDDHCLHSADMVGAVQTGGTQSSLLTQCKPQSCLLLRWQDRWPPAHRVIRCCSMTCTAAHQRAAHAQLLQGSALSLCLAARKQAAFAPETSPQCAIKPLQRTGCQILVMLTIKCPAADCTCRL